ncbi:MAG: formylglycine-generating enzyme family protein [Pseudomonadota bacterium]
MKKKANFAKWAGLWLLVASLPLMGIAGPPDITVDVVSKGAFVIFFLKNYENRDFQCASIRVEATVKDKDEQVALRTIMARNISLPAGSLEIKLEAGKEIIGALTNEMNQPRIVTLRKLTYRCALYKKVFRDRLKDGSKGPEMVWIPAGTFRMGDIQGGGHDNEKPVHRVSVSRFAMGRYEVTFAEYDKFAQATGRKKPDDKGWGRGNRPVINVSWHDATAYAEWLSQQTSQKYRLPTEAEWEYAARAKTETARDWGNNHDEACRYANVYDETAKKKLSFPWTHSNCGDGYVYTAPVGRFKPNQFALFDMLGNVWEWTCSLYEREYSGKEQQCLIKSPSESSLFVQRGSSWNDDARWTRMAARSRRQPTERDRHGGFRLTRLP